MDLAWAGPPAAGAPALAGCPEGLRTTRRGRRSRPGRTPGTGASARPGSAGVPHLGWFGTWRVVTAAVVVLVFRLGFRLACCCRGACCRPWWLSLPAWAVPGRRRRYTGETRFGLRGQNPHRYFFHAALVFSVILTWDAVVAFDFGGRIGTGAGPVVLVINAVLLWLCSLSCHACRHAAGGRINHFSRHPIRYRAWTFVPRLNPCHGNFARLSLVWVALADLYVRLPASGVIGDPRVF